MKNKGITLVALIITIIILLILAAVAIWTISGDGIIEKAKIAAEKYEEQKIKEEIKILQNEDEIAKSNGEDSILFEKIKAKEWCEEATLNSDGTITVKATNGKTYIVTNTDVKTKITLADYGLTENNIGDYVEYNEGIGYTYNINTAYGSAANLTYNPDMQTEDLKWRILGINEDGNIELISDTATTSKTHLSDKSGYISDTCVKNCENALNDVCNELYGKGEKAIGARSLNTHDIEELIGYNPKDISNTYGMEFQYRYPTVEEAGEGVDRKIQYSSNGGTTWSNTGYQTLYVPDDGTTINLRNPGYKKFIQTAYSYAIPSYKAHSDLIKTTKGHWLATRSLSCLNQYVIYAIDMLTSGNSQISYVELRNSVNSLNGNLDLAIRPVVLLSYDAKLVDINQDGIWEVQ